MYEAMRRPYYTADKIAVTILDQLVDDECGLYRLRHGDKIGYLTIMSGIFDKDTMCESWNLIPKLPPLPKQEWTSIQISKGSSGTDPDAMKIIVSNEPLQGVKTTFHTQHIEVLTLEPTTAYRPNVYLVNFHGKVAVCKIAAFEWRIPQMERETWAYSELAQYPIEFPDAPRVSPQVLGHVTEQGRVIGLLLERLEGRTATLADLPICTATLKRLHTFGMVHGDPNKYNFIINDADGSACMVDFEHASGVPAESDHKFDKELASLESELAEETGRGGVRIRVIAGSESALA